MAESVPQQPDADPSEQWTALMAAYQKSAGQAMSAAAPFMAGAMPFASMPFAQPFMYPTPMMFPGVPGFNPAAFAMPPPADGAAETKTENGVSEAKSEVTEGEEGLAETKDSEGPRTRKRGSLARAASGPSQKKAKGEGTGLGVKSNSSAALAMLAGAAAGKNPGAQAAAGAAQPQAPSTATGAGAGTDVWAGMMGTSAPTPLGSVPDMGKLTTEQAQLMGVTDERELKRLRRKQSNRESARRSRLRKQAECEALARQVKDLITENSKLKEEKLQLLAQIEILNAKLSMSTFGAVHALGQGELEKIQAELRKQTEAQQASMAAALAQVNATMAANGSGDAGDDKESQSDADE